MNHIAYIALGTNIGDRLKNIKLALFHLNNEQGIKIKAMSSIYETDPVGYEEQDPFLNMVIEVKTSLTPQQLLNICLSIEKTLGRKRIIRWGPRTIDLDILLYNDENMETENLTIPHPRMHERAFVLIPLLEINPLIRLPKDRRLLKDYLDDLSDIKGVKLWKQINGEDVFAHLEN